MPECFCGCGRPVSFTRRSPNALGRKVAAELEDWRGIHEAAVRHGRAGSEGLETFIDDGEWLYFNLQALVHGEPIQSGFSNRKVTKWLGFSRRSRTTFGRRVLHGAEPEVG